MEFTRRSFLAAIGLTVGGILLPSSQFDIVFPQQDIGILKLSDMRVMAVYSLDFDSFILRYDVFNGVDQLLIQSLVAENTPLGKLRQYHGCMVAALKKVLVDRKIPIKDLRCLPYPDTYKHPDWLLDISKNLYLRR